MDTSLSLRSLKTRGYKIVVVSRNSSIIHHYWQSLDLGTSLLLSQKVSITHEFWCRKSLLPRSYGGLGGIQGKAAAWLIGFNNAGFLLTVFHSLIREDPIIRNPLLDAEGLSVGLRLRRRRSPSLLSRNRIRDGHGGTVGRTLLT